MEGEVAVHFEVEVPGKLMKKMAPALVCMSKLLKVRAAEGRGLVWRPGYTPAALRLFAKWMRGDV